MRWVPRGGLSCDTGVRDFLELTVAVAPARTGQRRSPVLLVPLPRAIALSLLTNAPKLLIVNTRLRQGHVLLGKARLTREVFILIRKRQQCPVIR